MEGRLEQEKNVEPIFKIPEYPKFNYVWVATFEDGSVIKQLDGEEGDDALNFKKVTERHDELVTFMVGPRSKLKLRGHKIEVNIKTGIITVNGQKFLPYCEKESLNGCTFQLEWWRRNYSVRGVSGVTPTDYSKFFTTYYIGWATWWKDKKIKRFVRIHKDDSLGIG